MIGRENTAMMPPVPIAALIRLARPWGLIALVAAAIPVAIAILARRRGRHAGRFSVALQCLAIGVAGAALSCPEGRFGKRADAPWMVFRDVSASTRGQGERDLSWSPDLSVETYRFADAILAPQQAPAGEETRIGPVLRLARAQAGRAAGVVVATDGRFHDSEWAGQAEALGRIGLEVLVVPLDRPPRDARIAELRADRLPDGRCELRVTVSSNAVQRRRLEVARGSGENGRLLERGLNLLNGDIATFRLTDPGAPADRSVTYHARLSQGDEFPENDAASAAAWPVRTVAAVVARESVEVPPGLGERSGVRALRRVSPADAPTTAAGWMDYAGVVLVDSGGTLLDDEQRAALAEYVRNGGGLVLVGAGPHAGPADREDPLNKTAALLVNPYERTPLKVIVVLDASGSMGEPGESARIKFDAAINAVMALKRHLTERDALAVITFSDEAKRVYDSGDGPPDFAALHDALAAVRPSGSTHVQPALIEATQAPSPAGLRGLVLLVSDLMAKEFDPQQIALRFRERKLSLAIVETRSPGDSEPPGRSLEKLAALLNAPRVRRETLAGLAEIFARFLRDARGEALRRGKFSVTAAPELFGRPPGALPDLDAYLLAAPQREAEVLARVGDDPILARRRVGLGRTVALAVPMDDPKSNRAWRASAQWEALLTAATRWVLAPEPDPRFTGTLRRTGGKFHVTVEATDSTGSMNLLELTAAAARGAEPAGGEETPLLQTAPGRYEARIDTGTGPVALAVRDPGGRVVWRSAGASTCPPEFQGIGPDWGNLRRLAELTGGQILAVGALPEAGRDLHAQTYRPLWAYLLCAALGVMLLDWALTRVRARA